MKLSCLINACPKGKFPLLQAAMSHDPDISSIASNSRDVRPGGLFIAVKGLVADGHDYIEQAFENGAAAVIAQTNPKQLDHVFLVENTRLSMAAIAAEFYGHPSKEMTLVGITGTNGKTTTTWLLESIFNACHFSTGVIGTINIRYKGQVFNNDVTTPDSIDLQKTLHGMKEAGVTHVIMEVSSHGLDLNRVDFCHFDVGVFTNLTQDHLDYHRTIDEYFECKKRFFTEFIAPKGEKTTAAVLNIDDPRGEALLNELSCKTLAVSTKKHTPVFARDVTDTIHGLSGILHLDQDAFRLTSALTGRFNLENILCAAGAAFALNIGTEQIKKGLEDCRSIPGRLEKIDTPLDRFVFVDYAHTPDALASILITLEQRAPKRVITVFGCGGNRDRSKRPVMGQIACKHSDIAIVTSDNPRKEAPDAIVQDIIAGLDAFTRLTDQGLDAAPSTKGYLVEVDRKKALKKAIFISKPGDIIVAAGKGHETYQITNTGTIHFDDKEELQTAAREFADQFTPIPWTMEDLSRALGSAPVVSTLDPPPVFTGISTDSRTIHQSQVFLALRGESFDGHAFINGLVDKGTKGIIAEKGFTAALGKTKEKEWRQKGLLVFEAKDTTAALGRLARYQRLRSKVKLLAITGSSGKTTTRRMAEEIFSTRFHVLATAKNFNNEIGVPQTLLNLSFAHEWAIVEMGMNHAGEISRLSRIACPDIAMVVNTAGVHLEGLGTLDNVARAKAEIFDGIREKGTAILFAEDLRRPILEATARKNKNIDHLLFFGSGPDADIQSAQMTHSEASTDFTVLHKGQARVFSINSPARFMVDNSLAAITAAITAGISEDGIRKGLAAFTPVSGRMTFCKLSDTLTLIDDTYNANPASVTQALATLAFVSGTKKSIAVLGDMLELGDASDRLHWDIGKTAALSGLSKLYVFGNKVEQVMRGAIENHFPPEDIFHGTKEDIARKVLENVDTETWVLVKGSRGMAMETVIQELQKMLTVHC